MNKPLFLIAITLLVAFISACRDKDIDIPNEEELITTVDIRLIPVGGGEDAVLRFRDPDGDGGLPPQITADPLSPATTYDISITLLNEAADPVVDITPEVEAEGADHQFFFSFEGVAVAYTYADQDENGFPVGLQGRLETMGTGQGMLTLVLRHLPVKDAAGVADGDLTNAGGETDIEISLPITIQ